MDATINSVTERRQLAQLVHMAGSGFDRDLNEADKRAFDQACARSVNGLIGGLIRCPIRCLIQ
jgi:hypothetical protein